MLNWRKRPIGESQEAREALTILIGGMHAIQNSYNVPDEYLELRIVTFRDELAGYCYEDVEKAFKTHMRRSPNVPTVHHILTILDPPPPVFTPVMYYTIKRKMRDNVFVSELERESCRFYEQQELNKVEQMKHWQQQRQASGRNLQPLQIIYTSSDDDAEEDWEAA